MYVSWQYIEWCAAATCHVQSLTVFDNIHITLLLHVCFHIGPYIKFEC